MRPIIAISLLTTLAAAGCSTTPEVETPVIIVAPPVQTCASVSSLQKVVIPAETKEQIAITEIENPPYEPIQTRVTRTVVVKPAQVLYVDSEGKEVFDICEKDTIEMGPVGPGPGEIIGEETGEG